MATVLTAAVDDVSCCCPHTCWPSLNAPPTARSPLPWDDPGRRSSTTYYRHRVPTAQPELTVRGAADGRACSGAAKRRRTCWSGAETESSARRGGALQSAWKSSPCLPARARHRRAAGPARDNQRDRRMGREEDALPPAHPEPTALVPCRGAGWLVHLARQASLRGYLRCGFLGGLAVYLWIVGRHLTTPTSRAATAVTRLARPPASTRSATSRPEPRSVGRHSAAAGAGSGRSLRRAGAGPGARNCTFRYAVDPSLRQVALDVAKLVGLALAV